MESFLILERQKVSLEKDIIEGVERLQDALVVVAHLQTAMFLFHREAELDGEVRLMAYDLCINFFKNVEIEFGAVYCKIKLDESLLKLKMSNFPSASSQISTEPTYNLARFLQIDEADTLDKITKTTKTLKKLHGLTIIGENYLYGTSYVRHFICTIK